MERGEEDLQVGKALLNKNFFLLSVIFLTATIAVFIFSQNSPVLAGFSTCGGQEYNTNYDQCCGGNIIDKKDQCCGSGSNFCSNYYYWCYQGTRCVDAKNTFGDKGYTCERTTCPSGQKACGGGCIASTADCCGEYTKYTGSCRYETYYTYCVSGAVCLTHPIDGSLPQCQWTSCPAAYPNLCGGNCYSCSSGYTISCGPPLVCNLIPPPSTVTVDIKANNSDGPISLPIGSTGTLSWTVSGNPSGCDVSETWFGRKSFSGDTSTTASFGVFSNSQTFTLNCVKGVEPMATDSVTVNGTSLTAAPIPTTPPTPGPTYCGSGGTSRATGLVSTPSFSSGSNFATTGACIIDPKTAFAPFKIPTFDDLESLYFDQSKASKATLSGDQTGGIDLTGRNDKIYHISGNLTLDNPSNIRGNQTGVIFIDGNLTIGPIPGHKLQSGTANSGLVFVVKGDVNIDPSVTQVDAVIISEDTIYTAGANCTNSSVTTSSALTINGSLISLNPDKPIKFCRKLSNNSQPAEKINHQVKYLVILRDLLSDTLQRWSEIP